MDADAAQAWFIAGTVPVMLGGGLHALASLLDTVRPTFFTPVRQTVRTELENTSIRLLPIVRSGGKAPRSMWKIWLGINIGFGLAVFMVGLSWLLIATHDYALVESIGAIEPLTIVFSASFLVIALRYWFYGPMLIAGSATACFSIAAVLS